MNKVNQNILSNTYTNGTNTFEVLAVFPGGVVLKNNYSGKVFSVSDREFRKDYRKVVAYYG